MVLEKKIFYETLFREYEEKLIEIIKNHDKNRLSACLIIAEYSYLVIELNCTILERFNIYTFARSDYSDREEIYELFYDYFERLKERF